jgi:phosphoribosyl-ATP pyrophosphohydrolase
MNGNDDILEAVYQLILERKHSPTEQSYVASLYARGLDKILGKIGEEATEVAVAGKGGDPAQVISEAADLIFHLLVLLGHYELPPERVYAELRRRFGTSGLAEKAARTKSSSRSPA